MTTPSGTISMGQIIAEFGPSAVQSGLPNRSSLGNYRRNDLIAGRNWPLDSGVPSSNAISFGNLKGKTLNVVVDYSGPTVYGTNSETEYNLSTTNVFVVGGFKSRPSSTSGTTKKVHFIIRKQIGSPASITSISPTEALTLNTTRPSSNPPRNTLGPFALPWAGTTSPVGVTTTSSFLGYFNAYGSTGSGCVIGITKFVTVIVVARGGSTRIKYTYHSYSASINSGGFGYDGSDISVNADGRTFTFDTSRSSSVSFNTGSGWNSAVLLNYIVANGGGIYGYGGRGGDGPNGGGPAPQYRGFSGESGGTAFSVNTNNCVITVEVGGLIGAGAGGGGGGGYVYVSGNDSRHHGGGGGGGAGLPAGGGGSKNGRYRDTARSNYLGGDGGSGSLTSGGVGGNPPYGSPFVNSPTGLRGGDGGNLGSGGNNGIANNGSYGTGGSAGYSILRNGFSPTITLSSAPRIYGTIL